MVQLVPTQEDSLLWLTTVNCIGLPFQKYQTDMLGCYRLQNKMPQLGPAVYSGPTGLAPSSHHN